MENDYVIETNNLSKLYNGRPALERLNLKVQRNSIFGFLGPNGAGKTTTMKLLLGLISPTEGKARIFNQDIRENGIAIRQKIGYLPQDIRMYDHMTAREILQFTARFYFKGPQDKIRDRVNQMLALVELANIADRPIRSFSGGERQRLGIAQAEVNHPELLILDEPAANLDPIGRRDVLRILKRLREDTTVFYSTHILDDVQKIGDTVAILNKGKLVTQGSIDSILSMGGNTYNISLKGPIESIKARLTRESWVTSIQTFKKNGADELKIGVSDKHAAEDRLLRLILQEERVKVVKFSEEEYQLEDIFMELIKEGKES